MPLFFVVGRADTGSPKFELLIVGRKKDLNHISDLPFLPVISLPICVTVGEIIAGGL